MHCGNWERVLWYSSISCVGFQVFRVRLPRVSHKTHSRIRATYAKCSLLSSTSKNKCLFITKRNNKNKENRNQVSAKERLKKSPKSANTWKSTPINGIRLLSCLLHTKHLEARVFGYQLSVEQTDRYASHIAELKLRKVSKFQCLQRSTNNHSCLEGKTNNSIETSREYRYDTRIYDSIWAHYYKHYVGKCNWNEQR